MDTSELTPPPAAAVEPLALRLLRIVALIGLALILTLFLGLAVVASSRTAAAALEPLVTWTGKSESIVPGVLTISFIVLVPVVLVLAAWRLRLLTWRWIAVGYLLTAPVLIYLAWDDPVVLRPVTIDELSPAFAGAEKSFAVLMRYGKQQPAAAEFGKSKLKIVWSSSGPSEPDKWREYLLKNRAGFEADWETLAPQRAWWKELNGFDRIGDLTPARYDAEIISFQVFRTMSQRGCAAASLLAIDGQGDAAIDTLLPVLEVGCKLQPSARTLVRFMIGIVIERLALSTAEFVLAQSNPSPAAKARLAAALERARFGEAGARHMIAVEYALALGGSAGWGLGDWVTAENERLPWLRRPLNLVSPLVYNPRASMNLLGRLNAELADLAARREVGKVGPRSAEFVSREGRPRFKNFMGSMILGWTPAYSKVVDTYWKAEDQRAALLAKVRP
jgi:hypothetical protein